MNSYQQLPKGQINPAATPVDTFFTQRRPELQEPARPLEMPAPTGIQTLGTGGTGGYTTQNKYAALVDALSPFSRELIKFGETAGEAYASSEYQKGLNEALKAARLLQGQAEQSADIYAAENRAIYRKDPVAGLLADSMNPYRRGGIETGLAKAASADVSSIFNNAYSREQMNLAQMEPGSPGFVRFQSATQDEALRKYGLNLGMPAVQKYFLPEANKAWEKTVERQWDDRQKLLKAQTPLLIKGEISSLLRNAASNGVVEGYEPNGEFVQYNLRGTPEEANRARQLLSAQATSIFDGYARKMGISGEPAKVVKEVWLELWNTANATEAYGDIYGQEPGATASNQLLRDVLLGVGIGPPIKGKDGALYREFAANAYGLDGIESMIKWDKAAYDSKEIKRKTLLDEYEGELAAATMGVSPGPDMAAAIAAVQGDERFSKLSAADKAAAAVRVVPKVRDLASYGMDPNAGRDLIQSLEDIPLKDLNSKDAYERLREGARGVPDEQRPDIIKEGQALIRRRLEEKSKFDPMTTKSVERAVIKELAERYPTSILELSRGGKNVDIYSLRSHSNANLREAAYRVESGMLRAAQDALLQAEAKNPQMSASQKQAVIDAALENYSNSDAFKKNFPGIGENPNADGTPSKQAATAKTRGVYKGAVYSSSQLQGLSDGDIRAYRSKPVLSAGSLRSELDNAIKGRGYSVDLSNAAKRAGTTPLQMLREQLRFYPSIQVPKQLLDELQSKQQKKVSRTTAGQQISYNPITGRAEPMNWLARTLMPSTQTVAGWALNALTGAAPAQATTFDPRIGSAYESMGAWRARDGRGQSLIAMATRNGWNPADLAAIVSFETGGTLNPAEPGRGAAAGRIGLIQAGPNERAAYGLGTGDWNREMLGIEKYLKARGAKPGMGLADLYATVNGGNPKAGYTPDGNGVVARSPETLKALERHRQQALSRLGMVRASNAAPLSSYRSQVSSITLDNGQPGIDVFFENKRIPAVLSGRVKDIGYDASPGGRGYGHYVVVESTDPATGQRVDVLYAHLPEKSRLDLGATVRAGQVIGRQGGTGRVVSADGTISSIDFLAPRPAGSRDMTPYRGYDALRRRIAQQLGG